MVRMKTPISTPLSHKAKFGKQGIKSSTEKRETNDAIMKREQIPKLRSTLSARNLLSGGYLLNKVAEFCNQLKNLATRARDKENADNEDDNNVEKQEVRDQMGESVEVLSEREKGRKRLPELSKEKSGAMEISGPKGQQRSKKRNDDAENTPISVEVKNIKLQEAGNKLPIRISPPAPQCFSAGRRHSTATALCII